MRIPDLEISRSGILESVPETPIVAAASSSAETFAFGIADAPVRVYVEPIETSG